MVKFSEIPKKVIDAVGAFTQEQLEARERRLSSPALQRSLEQTADLLKDDLKSAGARGLEAAYRFTFGAPLSSMWAGTKELGSVIAHNFSVKKSKQKKSYFNVPAAMITELLNQYGKGIINTTQLAGNLSKALARTTVLAGRYLIGK